jgi:lipoprotein NlpI
MMLRRLGAVVAAFLTLSLLCAPIGVRAEDPCSSGPDPDEKIAACTAVLLHGNLSAADKARAYNNRGNAYDEKDQEDLAIADYSTALKIDPKFAIAYRNRGRAYNAQGKYDLAIRDFSAAVRIVPHYVDAYVGRGNAYRAKDQGNLAIADYDAALRFAPSSAYAYNGRGSVYQSRGQMDLAMRDFTTALRFMSNFADALYNRGNLYHTNGQDDLAIFDYTAALRSDPKNAYTLNSRGIAYHTKGLEEYAIADYSSALIIDPNFVAGYNNRGLSQFIAGRFAESAADFKRASDLQPANAYAVLWIHIARLRNGDTDDDLATRSALLDNSKWPAPILGIYQGRQTPDGVLAAVSDPDQRCEALFYAAEWQLWQGQAALAQTGFGQALTTCKHSFIEYQAAQAELTRLPK